MTVDPTTTAERRYCQRVVQVYNQLNLSGIGDEYFLSNAPLEDLFVRLTLTTEQTIREAPVPTRRDSQPMIGPRELDQHVLRKESVPITLRDALDSNVLIVGEPGAGKSTLLRWLAVTFAQDRQHEADRLGPAFSTSYLPILLELGMLPKPYLSAERGAPN